jgi:hypothetical protein
MIRHIVAITVCCMSAACERKRSDNVDPLDAAASTGSANVHCSNSQDVSCLLSTFAGSICSIRTDSAARDHLIVSAHLTAAGDCLTDSAAWHVESVCIGRDQSDVFCVPASKSEKEWPTTLSPGSGSSSISTYEQAFNVRTRHDTMKYAHIIISVQYHAYEYRVRINSRGEIDHVDESGTKMPAKKP